MGKIMNEENDWDHNVEEDAAEGPAVCISREEVLQALNENRKSSWKLRSIIGIDCCWQRSRSLSDSKNMSIPDGFWMPVEWALCIVVAIFKGKGDIRKCSCHRAVKLLEHAMKVVERVLEKRLCINSDC